MDTFRDFFRGFENRYVLIGGAATWLLLDDAGLKPRATKDLDIVLCLEAFDDAFADKVWSFVELAKYQRRERADGAKNFYRFTDPESNAYPFQIELFSRSPDDVALRGSPHLTPIPTSEDVASLSAILLNDAYYAFLHSNVRAFEGMSLASESALIVLKAKAWLDLSVRKKNGEHIRSTDLKKHRSDAVRLSQLLTPGVRNVLAGQMADDMREFLGCFEKDMTEQYLRSLKLAKLTPGAVVNGLHDHFGTAASLA